MTKVYYSQWIDNILEKIDFSQLGEKIAIKLHFGEKGCETYINPEIVKAVYDKIKDIDKKADLVDCNVLYKGSRTRASQHRKVAREHGFDFAPIKILDGEKGDKSIEVAIENGLINSIELGEKIKNYDSMIVLTHFKGHGAAGYGGSFKNMGMGLASRSGKLSLHSKVKPSINQEKCTGCSQCIDNCNANAISLNNGKAEIDQEKCNGCAMCISVCSNKAVDIPWDSSTSEELQKKIVDSCQGIMKLIGKQNIIYINVLEDITSQCDCLGSKQEPIMDDIGILFSKDPVAIDQASLDLANKKSKGKFDEINNIDKSIQVNYSLEKGLGEKEYQLLD